MSKFLPKNIMTIDFWLKKIQNSEMTNLMGKKVIRNFVFTVNCY